MNSSYTQNALLMLQDLSVRLAPFYTAQDSSELARRLIVLLVSAAALGWGLLRARLAQRMVRASASGRPLRMAGALPVVALLAVLLPGVASAQERVYLTKTQIETRLMGQAVVSRNIASGKLSHWEFHGDGTVLAVSLGGLGRASGTWSIRDDGQTCVKMLGRIGCRYWFRNGNAYANADTNQPDAPIVAEVQPDH